MSSLLLSGDRQCRISSPGPLAAAANLLQVSPEALNRALTVKVMRIRGQDSTDVLLSDKEVQIPPQTPLRVVLN